MKRYYVESDAEGHDLIESPTGSLVEWVDVEALQADLVFRKDIYKQMIGVLEQDEELRTALAAKDEEIASLKSESQHRLERVAWHQEEQGKSDEEIARLALELEHALVAEFRTKARLDALAGTEGE